MTTEFIHVHVDSHVAVVELRKPPYNYVDVDLVDRLADVLEALDADPLCRVIVLCAAGKAFCGGADFAERSGPSKIRNPREVVPLYVAALRVYACNKPMVAAVHGAAIGGGLGLALAADFRIGCPEARFSANFNRLGFHPGFGMTVTLPRLVGLQHAASLFYTGRRIDGNAALAMGLIDRCVPREDVRPTAIAMASEIAASAPLAVMATRATLRAGLVDQIRLAVVHESAQQSPHFASADFLEGVAAMKARRPPVFRGR